MRRPKVASTSTSWRGSQAAGRLEQPRGLEVAALEVALARDRGVPRVGTLHQLARRERRRRVREHLHVLRDAARPRARRRPARTAGRRPPSPSGARTTRTRSRRPRRSGAASSTSSWTSVAEWTSSTATAPRSRRSASASSVGGPAARKTSSGRRRLPPAAIVALAGPASTSPWPRGQLLQARLEAVHQRRDVRSGGVDDGENRLRRGHYDGHPPVVHGDDAAGGQHPAHVDEAGVRQTPGQRLRVGEAAHGRRQIGVGVVEAAEQRHDTVEPDAEEGRQRRSLRRS